MDIEKRRASWRAYDARNRVRRAAAARAYSKSHRDQINARDRADWAAGDPAKRRAIEKYRATHQAAVRAYMRAWRTAHPDSPRAEYLRHRDGYLRRAVERRARERSAPGSFTTIELREKIALLGGCCIYCGRSDVKLGPDHKIPLSRGGSNDITNIVPACKPCNSRKRHRTASEFLALQRTA